ncbi:MAG: heme o synthase [Planctomycetales bacterium]|nr:heme o synthase [Planctomycetales bacterium]
MSTSLSTVQQSPISVVTTDPAASSSRVADYVELCKPRILTMALVAMAVAGVTAASGIPNWIILTHALIGTTFVAASSSIFNQVFERFADAEMARTRNRPIAAGRIRPVEALLLGAVLLVIGTAYLFATTNLSVAALALATWILYALVYTPLKRITVLNTVVGAIPGALPIWIGWTAASGGTIDQRGVWLFATLFVWQFPHFMAIAWLYKTQYANAGYRMMSTDDDRGVWSGITAVVGAAILLVLVLAAPQFGMGSLLSVVPAALLAICQLGYSFAFLQNTNDFTARRLLRASLIFLPAHLIIITLSQFGIL